MSATVLPQRRQDQLVAKQVGDETVIYDLTNDQVINLPATTAKVWAACDGDTDINGIAAFAGVDAATAGALLGELADRGLLVDPQTKSGLSRRQLIVRGAAVGAGVAALPVIQAIPAAAADACITIGGTPEEGTGVCLCDAWKELIQSGQAPDDECKGFRFFGKERDDADYPKGTRKYLTYKGGGVFRGGTSGLDPDVYVGALCDLPGPEGACGVKVGITHNTNVIFSYVVPPGTSLECVTYEFHYPDPGPLPADAPPGAEWSPITIYFYDSTQTLTEMAQLPVGGSVDGTAPWVLNAGQEGLIAFIQNNTGIPGSSPVGEICVNICPANC